MKNYIYNKPILVKLLFGTYFFLISNNINARVVFLENEHYYCSNLPSSELGYGCFYDYNKCFDGNKFSFNKKHRFCVDTNGVTPREEIEHHYFFHIKEVYDIKTKGDVYVLTRDDGKEVIWWDYYKNKYKKDKTYYDLEWITVKDYNFFKSLEGKSVFLYRNKASYHKSYREGEELIIEKLNIKGLINIYFHDKKGERDYFRCNEEFSFSFADYVYSTRQVLYTRDMIINWLLDSKDVKSSIEFIKNKKLYYGHTLHIPNYNLLDGWYTILEPDFHVNNNNFNLVIKIRNEQDFSITSIPYTYLSNNSNHKRKDYFLTKEELDLTIENEIKAAKEAENAIRLVKRNKLFLASQEYIVDKYNHKGYSFEVYNCFEKDIKYVIFTCIPYNKVNDIEGDSWGHKISTSRGIGPLKPGAKSKWIFEKMFKDDDHVINRVGLTKIEIIFMDGTKIIYNGKDEINKHRL